MNTPKCTLQLYTNFLIGTQKQYSGMELSKVSPQNMAHDAVNRWLAEELLTPKKVWQNIRDKIDKGTGCLCIDDSLLDKPYSKKISLAKYQYSGKHHGVAKGIDIVNMIWTNGEQKLPVDYRVYEPTFDGKTKNDHAQEMLSSAKKRGFSPQYVLMDSWFSSVKNLQTVKNYNWKWITEFKCNRKISLIKGQYLQIQALDWTQKRVYKVWLKEYGFILVTKTVAPNGDVAYLATNDLTLDSEELIRDHYSKRWDIEVFHRDIKQCCGIEKCYSCLQRSQRNHILCSFLAFIKLEMYKIKLKISCYEVKWSIIRPAVSNFLASTP